MSLFSDGIQEPDDLVPRIGLREHDPTCDRLHLLCIAGHVQDRQVREALAIGPRYFPAVCFRHADVGQQSINGNVNLQGPECLPAGSRLDNLEPSILQLGHRQVADEGIIFWNPEPSSRPYTLVGMNKQSADTIKLVHQYKDF
jgi:hypothetical protein